MASELEVGKARVGTSASTETLAGFSDSQAAIVGGDNVGLALQSTNSNKSARVRFFDHSGNQDATVGFDNSNSNLFMGTGTSAHLSIDSTGNVGIACDPDAKLEVNGDSIWLGNASSDASGRILFNENTSSNGTQGFSLLYAGATNPTLDGTTFTAAANSFNIIRHTPAWGTAGTVAMSVARDTGLCTFSSGINLGDTNLSNYKEGTWTPVLAISGGNDGGTLTQTAGALGKYVRIGKMVHVMGIINVTAASGLSGATTIVQVNGFPFTADVNATYNYQYRFNFSREDALTSRKPDNFISFYSASTTGFVYDSGLGTGITGNELTTGKLVFSGSYITT